MDENKKPISHMTCDTCLSYKITSASVLGEQALAGICGMTYRRVNPYMCACRLYKPANQPVKTEGQNAIQ